MRAIAIFVAIASILFYLLIQPRYSNVRYDDKNRVVIDETFYKTAKPGLLVDILEAGLERLADLSLTAGDLKQEAKNRCCKSGKTCNFWKTEEAFWEKNLQVLLYSLENEANLRPIGRFMMRESLISNLCSQIALNYLLETNPEVENETIASIQLSGPGRSGSTNLLSLMSLHPDATYLTVAEALNPIAPSYLGARFYLSVLDERYWKALIGTKLNSLLVPLFDKMFRNFKPLFPMEELFLGAPLFDSLTFVSTAFLPTYDAHIRSERFNHTITEQFTKLMLKAIQFQRGGKRKLWILKTPQTVEVLKHRVAANFNERGGQNFIFTQRNAVELYKSTISMLLYIYTSHADAGKLNYKQISQHWLERTRFSMEKSRREEIAKHVKNPMHVRFPDYMKDPITTVLSCFQYAGLSVSDQIVDLVKDYVEKNPREGSNVFSYELEYLLKDTDIQIMFKDYHQDYAL